MRKIFYLHVFMLGLLLLNASCKRHMLNYPYAENNTTMTDHFGVTVSDDYRWLEMNPANNLKTAQWFQAQSELSHYYFKDRSPAIYNKIEELLTFPRFTFIRSSTDTLYYAGIYPYSEKVDIYKYNDGKNELIKQLYLPSHVEDNLNALIINDGRHIALIARCSNATQSNIYIYDLRDNTSNPVCKIKNVINYPLIPKSSDSFFFVRDAFASKNATLGINNVYVCKYTLEDNRINLDLNEFYHNKKGNSGDIFDLAFDNSDSTLFIGKYDINDPDKFLIVQALDDHHSGELYYSLESTRGEYYRLSGADDVNLYIISVDKALKGTLYALNKKTKKMNVVIQHNKLNMRYFSLIKNYAIVSFQNESDNKIYVINKHTLKIIEVPVEDNNYYKFYHNKLSHKLYYIKESLIEPKEVFQVDSVEYTKSFKVDDSRKLPFNPEDYQIEHVKVKSSSGNDVNLQLTYKKGMVRNGSNPMIILTFLNAQGSYLDKFSLARVLYMDFGFIFVQRAMTDSHTQFDISDQMADVYSAYNHLIQEKYTSPDKVAFIGREFGASAILEMLNKYELSSPVVLFDGVYDYVYYNNYGRKLFHNKKVFQATDSISFKNIYQKSPYHQLNKSGNYPPMLLVSSGLNKLISPNHTYRLTARMQMRTKAKNPILMLTPDHPGIQDERFGYIYKMYLEYGFAFITKQLGIPAN